MSGVGRGEKLKKQRGIAAVKAVTVGKEKKRFTWGKGEHVGPGQKPSPAVFFMGEGKVPGGSLTKKKGTILISGEFPECLNLRNQSRKQDERNNKRAGLKERENCVNGLR